MIIGIDFDNTIVAYDQIIHRLALEMELIPAATEPRKNAIRDHLRRAGRETDWTRMQGIVYGPRLAEAEPYPGSLGFMARAAEAGHRLLIISHRTQFPYIGEKHDLHAAAREWIERRCAGVVDSKSGAFFEVTKEAKVSRISACGCDVFIDDLPEILAAPAFPSSTRRILFDPAGAFDRAECERVLSWEEIARRLL